MDRLRLIKTFVAVARARSFNKAAGALGISRSNVTKQVAALEALLKVQLLNRSTHSMNLTDAGLALLEEGDRLVNDFEALEQRMHGTLAEPRGIVRVGTPPSFGAFHLVRAIQVFKRGHPDIHIALVNDDGLVDIIKGGLDFSIRIAHGLRDTSLISRLLTRVPQVLVAGPEYVAQNGGPDIPADLADHNCLIHTVKAPTSVWRFRKGSDLHQILVRGSLVSNFGEAIRAAALLGEGVAMHPPYMVNDDIRAGKLVRILSDYEPMGLEVRAVYARREMPARVSLFLAFIQRWLKEDPQWLRACERIGGADERPVVAEIVE